MILSRKQIVNIIRQTLQEIGMEIGTDAEMDALTISRILEELHDAGGTDWDPSPNVLAGLIVILFLEKKNYPRRFNGKWLTNKDDDETTVGALVDYLNEQQTDLE